MTDTAAEQDVRGRFYLLGSRPLTHVVFWLGYYLLFSLIWMRPEEGLFASFYLEFVLLPPRALAVYGLIYFLMPRYLLQERYREFLLGYALLLLVAGALQRLSGYFFYERLMDAGGLPLSDPGAILRSVILVNTTAIVVGAVKMYQFYWIEVRRNAAGKSRISLRSNRRTHLVDPDDIFYVEGMGNYVTYCLRSGEKLVVHGSVKAAQEGLPDHFLRLHRSFIANKKHIRSFSAETVVIGTEELPRGKEITDEELAAAIS
ncbi:LytR/AlgR family response regulator transcription factor [Gimibacter soli]|uniref:LytTR family DNA-binding domain-containing protein n=1 Tax=Gimibacter soli TaxID=3024400 RepID=A0AAF0BKX5_9PROT|nr:LytTR family DNA-binding domain-containing protein [Gimibacter soli]WCL54794.1 LytTR family DNA-binding domain-containing protein [Gimibacter soli]